LGKIGVLMVLMNFVHVYEEGKKKNQPTLNIMILEMTRNWTPKFVKVVGIQVNYKILRLKFSEKLLFSINPPISAHALLSGSFGSVTSKNFRG
jgi:hypothetical protein